jgi:hypothetical protein
MDAKEFLERAMSQIPDKPYDRLTPLARTRWDNHDTVFDVHCHIFNRKCISIYYLLLRFFREVEASATPQIDALKEAFKKSEMNYSSEEIYELTKHPMSLEEEEISWQKLENSLPDQSPAEYSIKTGNQLPSEDYGLGKALLMLLKKGMLDILDDYMENFAFNKHTIETLKNSPLLTCVIMMDIQK